MFKKGLATLTAAFCLSVTAGYDQDLHAQADDNTVSFEQPQTAPSGQANINIYDRVLDAVRIPVASALSSIQNIDFRTLDPIHLPDAPETIGDYDRDLPLQQCRRTIRAGDAADMAQVLHYMRHPNDTPNVESPGITREHIRMAQDHLRTLGFNLTVDGVQGPMTTRSVMEFQMFWGQIAGTMEMTGRIDRNTLTHMTYYARRAQEDSERYNVNTGVIASIRLAQLRTGIDFEFLTELIRQESSFRPGVGASTSSALGLTQFIESTWLNVIYTRGCDYGFQNYADQIDFHYNSHVKKTFPRFTGSWQDRSFLLGLRANPRFSAIMGAENSLYETRLIEHWLGTPLQTNTEHYLIHFKGVDAGYHFLRKHRETPDVIAAEAFPRQANANRNIYYERGQEHRPRSYRDIHGFLSYRFNTGAYREVRPLRAYEPPAIIQAANDMPLYRPTATPRLGG